MLPSIILALTVMASSAMAQTTGSASLGAPTNVASTTEAPSSAALQSATATSSKGTETHTINVGASGHKFTPDKVEANVGDIILWKFYPDGHWVIRGDFDNPCIPYEYVGLNREGFSSGPKPMKAITNDVTYSVRVNNTDPIFFYCGASGSCTQYHMMGVINESKNETLDEWLKKADGVDTQLRPGDPFPTEEDTPKASGSATADPGSGNNSDDEDDDKGGLSSGAIAGIAVGGAAVLILGAGLVYICGRRGGFDKAYRKSFRSSTTPQYPPGGMSEAQYGSPHSRQTDVWSGHKQPSPMSAQYGQSPPLSPQPTPGYGYQQVMPHHDGTMGSYYSEHPSQHLTPPPPHHQHEPPKQETVAPAELATSADPGNSPLPSYDNDRRTFSWAGEETAYRPTK